MSYFDTDGFEPNLPPPYTARSASSRKRRLPSSRHLRTMKPESLRDAIFEIRWHTEAGINGFERLDILKGYEQARMRLTRILDALDRADDALDVLISPEDWDDTWVNSKGCLREAYRRQG